MGIHVVNEVVIARPQEDVAAYVMDPHNDPVWIGGITEAKPLTELPVREGTRVARIASFLGKKIEYVLEVAEYVPNRLLGMKSVSGPFPMEVSYEFEPHPNGTLVRIVNRGGSTGFFKIAEPLMARSVKRNINGDLATLKELMEKETSAH